jgi:hypothetical protein
VHPRLGMSASLSEGAEKERKAPEEVQSAQPKAERLEAVGA